MKAGKAVVATTVSNPQRAMAAATGNRAAQVAIAKKVVKAAMAKPKPQQKKQARPDFYGTQPSMRVMQRQAPVAVNTTMTGSSLSTANMKSMGKATGILEIYATDTVFPGYTGLPGQFKIRKEPVDPFSPLFQTLSELANLHTAYVFSVQSVKYIPAQSQAASGTIYFGMDTKNPTNSVFDQIDQPPRCAEVKERFQCNVRETTTYYPGIKNCGERRTRRAPPQTEADFKNSYAFSYFVALEGFNGGPTDKVGDLYFDIAYELKNLTPATPPNDFQLTLSSATPVSDIVSFTDRKASQICQRLIPARDGLSYYWVGPTTTFNFTAALSTPGSTIATSLLAIKRSGTIIDPDRIDRVSQLSSDLAVLDTVVIDATITLKYGDNIALTADTVADSWGSITFVKASKPAVVSPY